MSGVAFGFARSPGKPVDLARVGHELARSNRILGKVRQIFALRKLNPLYIKSLATMFMVTGSANFFVNRRNMRQRSIC